jgi:hypothetical protein
MATNRLCKAASLTRIDLGKRQTCLGELTLQSVVIGPVGSNTTRMIVNSASQASSPDRPVRLLANRRARPAGYR